MVVKMMVAILVAVYGINGGGSGHVSVDSGFGGGEDGEEEGGGGTATLMICEVKEGDRGKREGGALKSRLSQASPRIARSVLSAK